MITARPLTARRIIAERIRGLLLGDTGAVFSPLNLFRNGEEGFYNDIQTYATTYFEDTAGTDTAELEDTIALILDQSQGPAGPELVTNGTFDTDSDWTKGTGWTIVDGEAVAVTETNSSLDQAFISTLGKYYLVQYTVTSYVSGLIRCRFTGAANVNGVLRASTGTFSEILFASSTNNILRFIDGGTGFNGSIDNVSVKELPGNHITQATAGARPKLSARYNLLERTEEFNIGWTPVLSTVTPNAAVAPNGETTADIIVPNAGAAINGYIRQDASVIPGATYILSWYAKQAGYRYTNTFDSGFLGTTVFDLELGSVVLGTGQITSLPNGWYRCSTQGTAVSTPVQPRIYASNTDTGGSYVSDGVSGIYIWGADIRLASDTDQPAYQRVTTATDYDSEGFDPYLQFDLVDDALVATIPAITGGTLVLATRDGIWIDDDINASAGTFSIGPTTYTGGPAGILSVIGNKLIGPPLLLDRQLTASEKNAVVQWFQTRGAGALYVLGEELIVNGTFDTDSDWTKGTGWTISGGKLLFSAGTQFAQVYQSLATTANSDYILTFDVDAVSSATIHFQMKSGGIGGTNLISQNFISTTGTRFVKFTAAASTTFPIVQANDSGLNVTLDNISVRELTQPGA